MEAVSALIVSSLARKMAFLPILYATIIYFQSDETYTGSGIKDQPVDMLLSHYDFIIIGGGSAGKNNTIILFLSFKNAIHALYYCVMFYHDIVSIISSNLNTK